METIPVEMWILFGCVVILAAMGWGMNFVTLKARKETIAESRRASDSWGETIKLADEINKDRRGLLDSWQKSIDLNKEMLRWGEGLREYYQSLDFKLWLLEYVHDDLCDIFKVESIDNLTNSCYTIDTTKRKEMSDGSADVQ